MAASKEPTDAPSATGRRHLYWSMPRQFRAHAAEAKDRVRMELLTDPWSVWCWGFEPIRRAIQVRYPTIEFRNLVGGMFPRMPKPDEVPFDVDRFFAQVQRTTGMPVDPASVRNDPPESTFPACIQYHAAALASPDHAEAFLRAQREAIYFDGLNGGRANVTQELARKVGIPADLFHEAQSSGHAEVEFKSRMDELTKNGLYAYPTLLLHYEERVARVEGFQTLPAVLGLAESISGRLHPPLPDPPLEQVIGPHERVATREVAEVLGMSLERTLERLEESADESQIQRHRFRTGDAWSRVVA